MRTHLLIRNCFLIFGLIGTLWSLGTSISAFYSALSQKDSADEAADSSCALLESSDLAAVASDASTRTPPQPIDEVSASELVKEARKIGVGV